MNATEEFDDLARRKLAELSYEPEEADWLAAQRLIAERKRTRWSWWTAGTLLILAIAGIPLLLTNDHVDGALPEQLTSAVPNAEPGTSTGPAIDLERSENGPIAPTQVVGVYNEATEEQIPTAESKANPAQSTRTASMPHDRSVGMTEHHSNTRNAPELSTTDEVHRVIPTAPVEKHMPTYPNNEQIGGDAPTSSGLELSTVASVKDMDLGGETAQTNSAVLDPTPVAPPTTLPTSQASIQTIADGSTDGQVGNVDPDPPGAEQNTSVVDPSSVHVVQVPYFPADSATSISATIAPQDSVVPTLIEPPLPTSTVSPWEVGLLAGGMLSRSAYTGGLSDRWSEGVEGSWAPSFGGELLWNRGNFALGTGLHYSTYQERINVDEERLTTVSVRDSNYFVPIDTTILYILGNVMINGQNWFVTESRDTTIDKLMTTTVTTTNVRLVREAIATTNRVSYMEIPLLLDAHLLQGAWSIGIRGGPFVGMLVTRSGILPNAEFNGTSRYADRTFRTTMFGATARAYIRYRFTTGWSIGVEPTWRTHFGDALSQAGYARRNTAIGAYLTLSYRLR